MNILREVRSAFYILLLLIVMGGLALVYLTNPTQTTPLDTAPTSIVPAPPSSYERMEMWNIRGDDTVQFTIRDTYPEAAPKRMKWFGVPFIWNDADMTESTPQECTVIEQRVDDPSYGGQTYRWHTYLVESDQRQFGYSATFKVLPHVHVTGTATRLLSIGVDPSNEAAKQNKSVIAVILPEGASDITITDMQPYKTLTYHGRTLYYYDVHSITTHQSIHIAYTLTGIPTTDIGIDTVIKYSYP